MKIKSRNVIRSLWAFLPIVFFIIIVLMFFPALALAQTLEDYLEDCLWICLKAKSPGVERDPSDHTRAFNPKTGQNFVYDKDKKAWIDAKTGECICPKCPPKETPPKGLERKDSRSTPPVPQKSTAVPKVVPGTFQGQTHQSWPVTPGGAVPQPGASKAEEPKRGPLTYPNLTYPDRTPPEQSGFGFGIGIMGGPQRGGHKETTPEPQR